MVLHVFTSFLGGVPLCIPYGLYSGTSVGETTRGILEGVSRSGLVNMGGFSPKWLKNYLSLLEEKGL